MKYENIALVRIDAENRLCIAPEAMNFQYIYRAAMDVHWDAEGKFLHAPVPRKWSHLQWFKQIINAVKDEYNCQLSVTEKTIWENVTGTAKEEMRRIAPIHAITIHPQ
ncbi:MAG: hypothetical protein JWL63_3410 [Rhodocyclales bacterium]|nr:hypothetical protein [Rhodocyclales bacterium]